jgi:Flp pilus assembly pilin Flp
MFGGGYGRDLRGSSARTRVTRDQYFGTSHTTHRRTLRRARVSTHFTRRCVVSSLHAFLRERSGLATIEYIVGVAVVLGTLVVGVSAWNNGLVARLQSLVTQLAGIR